MRCQTCGHDNKPEHTFCAKCLEMLDKKKTTVLGNKHSVNMPPQNEHFVDIQYSSPTPKTQPIIIWVAIGLIIGLIILFFIYG